MTRHFALIWAVWMLTVLPVSQALAASPIELLAAFNEDGSGAVLDLPCYRGAVIAVEEINAAGGVLGRPLVLVEVNTVSNASTTASVVQAALDEQPHVVAGLGYTDSTYVLEAGPVFQKAGLPFVSPGATDPGLPRSIGDNLFLACYGDDAQAQVMAEYAYHELKLRRVAPWIDQNTDYTLTVARFFAERFAALGGTVVRTNYPKDANDFTFLIDDVKSSNPACDGIYSASLPYQGAEQIQQTRAAGVNVPMMSGDGWATPVVFDATKGTSDPAYFTTHRFLGVDTPQMKAFIAAYTKRFDHAPPNSFAPLGYDTVKLIVNAIEQAGSTDPQPLLEAIGNTTAFPGIVGPISFVNGSHVPIKPVEVVRITDGKTQPVWDNTPTATD